MIVYLHISGVVCASGKLNDEILKLSGCHSSDKIHCEHFLYCKKVMFYKQTLFSKVCYLAQHYRHGRENVQYNHLLVYDIFNLVLFTGDWAQRSADVLVYKAVTAGHEWSLITTCFPLIYYYYSSLWYIVYPIIW